MIELTEKRPNAGDAGVADVADDTLTLPYEARQKSRHRVRLDSGREAAVVLKPGTVIEDGDRLVARDGTTVLVCAAHEPVSTASSVDPQTLARACYHLGNRHVALQVGAGWVRYQPDHVLDEMLRGLGLEVVHESTSFKPERGAYGGHSHSHTQSHSHGHSHPHSHDDESHHDESHGDASHHDHATPPRHSS